MHWTSIQELLKHFWSSYPITTSYLYTKVSRLRDAMSQIYPKLQYKLQEIKESVQSDSRHQVSLLVQPMLQVNLPFYPLHLKIYTNVKPIFTFLPISIL
ncbi:putative TFIIH subunit Tfb1/GTF2H1 protein [Helianthus annuus]|nr:putative TFIIH subunit Tfb1/GTF2H1 protein [Helianthus annuus]